MSKLQPPGAVKYRALTQSTRSVTDWAILDTFFSDLFRMVIWRARVRWWFCCCAIFSCTSKPGNQKGGECLKKTWDTLCLPVLLFQKPVKDLDFKIMFDVVMLFRSFSSFELIIAMGICSLSYYGVFFYFKLIQQNVYFWYMVTLCLHMHRLCNILLFFCPSIKSAFYLCQEDA